MKKKWVNEKVIMELLMWFVLTLILAPLLLVAGTCVWLLNVILSNGGTTQPRWKKALVNIRGMLHGAANQRR